MGCIRCIRGRVAFVQNTAGHITLEPETLLAFDEYVGTAETSMESASRRGHSFLASETPETGKRLAAGEVVAQRWSDAGQVAVPHGLIHDWIGATHVPSAKVDDVLAVVQDYDNHKKIYRPDVADSSLISRRGDEFHVYLRLLKRKIVTVVLDSEHDVRYFRSSSSFCRCRSRSTRIAEVENAGTPHEAIQPPDTGHGFLWRLNSYWTFQANDDGTLIECRAISLTRDVPFALRLLIQPMIRTIPKESLVRTLATTRTAVLSSTR